MSTKCNITQGQTGGQTNIEHTVTILAGMVDLPTNIRQQSVLQNHRVEDNLLDSLEVPL